MNEALIAHQERGKIDALVLRALVRKLVAKGLLSEDDVDALLFDVAKRMNEVGSEQTDQAARSMVNEDLAPAFLGPWWAPAHCGAVDDAILPTWERWSGSLPAAVAGECEGSREWEPVRRPALGRDLRVPH